jgi:hypothetical protein
VIFHIFWHFRYIHVLHDLIIYFNLCYHVRIKWHQGSPWAAGKRETVKLNFKAGDTVRISNRKGIFKKGYTPKWTQQVFKTAKRLPRIPPIHKIIDLLTYFHPCQSTKKTKIFNASFQIIFSSLHPSNTWFKQCIISVGSEFLCKKKFFNTVTTYKLIKRSF